MVNAEFFDALEQLEKEKGIPVDYMLDRVGQALITAYKRDNDGMTDNVYVEPNREEKTIRMYVRKTVVRTEDLYEPYEEITLEEAADYKVNPQVGDIIDIDIPTKSFGRIAAQTAKQVIIQGIREAERGMVISEFESKEHEILNATVARIDPRSGNAYLDVVSGGEKSEAVLTASEQVRGETLVEGQHVKVYLIEVRRGTRGVQVIVSRTHPGLVKRLFELEVPEIHSGVVEVKSIAREAGNRTKIAVTSHDENVDPIGACVGTRGARVSNITAELNGEKIDIIKWNEDTATFVSAALAPADVISASMQADGKSCRVIVPDDQLSLAIGKEGQNARLAAKLTGCKIGRAADAGTVRQAVRAAFDVKQFARAARQMPREKAAVQQVEPPGGQRRRRDMPLLMGYLEKRHRKQMRRTVRDAFSCQKAGHIRALDRARTRADADGAHLALRQSFDFFMQMHGVLKQRVRLPQADRTLGHGQQTAAVAPFAGLRVLDRSRGAVIGRIDPQKSLRHRSRPFPASRARPHPERR